jgi:type I restriction enzyme S subunit
MEYVEKNIPLWQITIWDKKFNDVDKKCQPKTIKYNYLLSDELDALRVDDGNVRILYTGKNIGYTTEELAGSNLSEGEVVSIPWGGIPTVKYYNGKFVTGDNRIATSSDTDRLLNKYLYYYMSANIHKIASFYRGASLKHPCMRDVLNMTISFPSIEKQEEICRQFDTLEKIIYMRKREMTLLEKTVRARFVEMFGDTVTNPLGWEEHYLGEYIIFLTSGSRGWAQYFVSEENELFITIKNVKNNHITLDDIQYVDAPNNKEAERTKVKAGDLLISITADLGRTGVVDNDIAEKGAYINQHLSLVRLNKEKINPLYVSYFLETEGGKRQFESKNQNGVKAGINFDAVKSLKVLVPPLNKQKEYLDFVAEVDKSKVAVQKALDKTQILFDSLMQKYFG